MASAVQSTEGGITYAEWSYAKDNKLGIAQVDNGAGPVELTGESVGKAVAAAKQDGEGNDLRLKLDYATKESRRLPDPPGHLRDRLLQGQGPGQGRPDQGLPQALLVQGDPGLARDIGYAPLPDEVRTKVTARSTPCPDPLYAARQGSQPAARHTSQAPATPDLSRTGPLGRIEWAPPPQ